MNIQRLIYFFVSISISCLTSLADDADTDSSDKSTTGIFDSRFHTLRLERAENPLVDPVLYLNENDRVVISFDELGDEFSRLQYKLVHCNADWKPSNLVESEYASGFNYADIEDYAFSSNTYIHFVNYRFEIPSDNLAPLVSGNYLVQIFPQDNPDKILLQQRLRVTDQSAAISGKASGRTDKGINTQWQQVKLTVSCDPNQVTNPLNDLIVTITQNSRPETFRILKQPLQISGSTLTFKSTNDLIFPAGNEYRRFETVRNNYPGMGVDSTRYRFGNYHAWLAESHTRIDGDYVYDQTQHGRYVIDEYNSSDPNLGADYITVHFSLDFPELIDADIYVEGDLNNRKFDDNNRMKYNPAMGKYELEMLLKQGSYNFQYVAKSRKGVPKYNTGIIEGNFAETSNEYNINVYLRTPTSRGDRLIGSATILSQ